jgi:peptide-methionine (S)-S-oxide reductase
VDNPTYEMVCGGRTGHAEAVLIEFDPKRVSYSHLLDVLWDSHSPEYARKGQYRSSVFTFGSEQAEQASASRIALEKRLGKPVRTEIEPATRFWLAEEYHQQYEDKTGIYACPSR